jgi:hypothetical protein
MVHTHPYDMSPTLLLLAVLNELLHPPVGFGEVKAIEELRDELEDKFGVRTFFHDANLKDVASIHVIILSNIHSLLVFPASTHVLSALT